MIGEAPFVKSVDMTKAWLPYNATHATYATNAKKVRKQAHNERN